MKKKAVPDNTDEPISDDARVQTDTALDKWFKRANSFLKSDGRDALGQLLLAARGDTKGNSPKKMTHAEAAVLARRMYDYLQSIEAELKLRGVSKSALCHRAFNHDDSKELSRLTLPPGADPVKRMVRVGAQNYLLLIQALAGALERNVSVVAGEILRGTKYQPLSKTGQEWSLIEKVQLALQNIVDKLDQEFGWFASYQLTAQQKCQGIEEGGTDCWPLSPPDSFMDDVLEKRSPEEQQQYELGFKVASDPSQAYIRRNQFYGGRGEGADWFLYGFETDVLQNDELFFVPHSPLGYLLLWDLPDRTRGTAQYHSAVAEKLADRRKWYHLVPPIDEWDADEKEPYGQTHTDLMNYFWILAYPHPNGGRLVPTLYCSGEEGGAYVLPLGMEGLMMLDDAVWHTSNEHCSALKRIQQMLIDIGEDGMNPIERAMRRTGPWLTHNPILKKHALKQANSRQLDALLWPDAGR